jgi:hypothetical protein
MKKLLYTTALMLMAATVFTSCIDLPKQQANQEKMQVEVKYAVNCSQDVLDAVDLVVIYKDKGGANATDTVRDTLWTKIVVHDEVPAKAGMNWSITPKPDSKLKKDTLDLNATYSMWYNGRVLDRGAHILTYRDFPVSRLQALCDFINLQRANFVEVKHMGENSYYSPCYVIRSGLFQDLESDIANWED